MSPAETFRSLSYLLGDKEICEKFGSPTDQRCIDFTIRCQIFSWYAGRITSKELSDWTIKHDCKQRSAELNCWQKSTELDRYFFEGFLQNDG